MASGQVSDVVAMIAEWVECDHDKGARWLLDSTAKPASQSHARLHSFNPIELERQCSAAAPRTRLSKTRMAGFTEDRNR